MNWTEEQLADFYKTRGTLPPPVGVPDIANVKYPRPKKIKAETLSGPLDVTLVLWGHCPSKKSAYRVTESGRMISDAETKSQIGVLQTQAMLQWGQRGPVEHPEVTTTFYVRSGRSDEDGKYVTLMDVLQNAGVIVNDNIAHFNGRKVHEPCVIVPDGEERVEIRLVKNPLPAQNPSPDTIT